MTGQTQTPSPETLRELDDETDRLEERAKTDGVLPDEDNSPDGGVGPQTTLVP